MALKIQKIPIYIYFFFFNKQDEICLGDQFCIFCYTLFILVKVFVKSTET